MTATDKFGLALTLVAVLAALASAGGLIGALAYAMTQHPQFIAIWPGAGMAVGIAMMDRTYGAARRYWAWAAVYCGALAAAVIALT